MLLARLSPKPPMRDDNVYVNSGKRLHLQTTNSVRDENPGVHSQALRELAVTNWN
jgi:hypothetical protein